MAEEVTDGGWGQEHVLMHLKDTSNAPNPGTEKPCITCIEVEDVCIKLAQPHMLKSHHSWSRTKSQVKINAYDPDNFDCQTHSFWDNFKCHHENFVLLRKFKDFMREFSVGTSASKDLRAVFCFQFRVLGQLDEAIIKKSTRNMMSINYKEYIPYNLENGKWKMEKGILRPVAVNRAFGRINAVSN
ncbi:hypothetical protein D5086_008385 [Populus alba]|uniref:Uncharacterized protein n=1 Tax=Populus alba TaxID=43335 RepID=A0ACC4CHU1_POPAL